MNTNVCLREAGLLCHAVAMMIIDVDVAGIGQEKRRERVRRGKAMMQSIFF